MEPVHLVCAHDACYRDWPWLCYANFAAVAKFDDDGRPLESSWGAKEGYETDLEDFLSAFGDAKALPITFWSGPGAHF